MAKKAWTLSEVRELLIQLWPEGQLYDWHNPASSIFKFLDASAEVLRAFGYEIIDRLRDELSPLTCIDKLADWESALGLETPSDAGIERRRASVLSRLREHGGFTRASARAVLVPLLGYRDPAALAIVETKRAAMRAAHTYRDAELSLIPIAPSVLRRSVFVPDGGRVGRAGAQMITRITHPALERLTIVLEAPDGRRRAWSALPRSTGSVELRLCAPEFAGAACGLRWSLTVTDPGPAPGGAVESWAIFVEGIGPGGLGGDIFDWGAFADPAHLGSSGVAPNLLAAEQAIERIKHAHTRGHLLRALTARPDTPEAIPDLFLPG
jgi:hypothetical protein